MSEIYKNFVEKNINVECLENCPLECEDVQLSPHVSMVNFPTLSYLNRLKVSSNVFRKYGLADESFDTIKNTIVGLSIHYDFLGYKSIKEVASMTLTDIISNIGGTFGNLK
jgi:hypothetical protein